MVNFLTLTYLQSCDLLRLAETTSTLGPCLTSGRICRKSPPKIVTLPQMGNRNNNCSLNYDQNIQQHVCWTYSSSHTKSFILLVSRPNALCLVVLYTNNSLVAIGTFSLECTTVLPTCKRSTSIPLLVKARAISDCQRIEQIR